MTKLGDRILAVLIVCFVLAPVDGRCQESSWRDQASERLRGIYQRQDFRASTVNPDWLDDSSGYTVRERDTENDRMVTARYDVASGERRVMERPQPNRNVSPDGKWIAESRDGRVWIRPGDGGPRKPLTNESEERDISFGAIHWSPSGRYLSFIERDSTSVPQRWVLVPGDPSYPKVAQNRFARVGETITSLRVGITDVETDELRWVSLDVPQEGFYLGQVDWIPGSDELLIEKLSRFRDVREFWIATPHGDLRRIYREVNEAWAVGSHGLNSGAHWIRNGESFVYLSEKDGWRHAWLLSRDGSSDTKLTHGDFDVINRVLVDDEGGWFYFDASPDNATQRYLHRVPLDGSGTLQRVTPENQPGTHFYDVSPDAKWAVHTYSTINDPPVVNLVSLPDHEVIRELENNRVVRERFETLDVPPTEFVQIEIGDDVVMDASITKPPNFDATKKYPIFVYVYGEPYLQTVVDQWGQKQIDFHRVVAEMGYVVVSIDNRGTAAPKGAAWRRSIFGSLGPLSTEDQAAAIQALAKTNPYLDLDRVGIWGWSGGGSNTLNAMFRKPDVYHVGIAVVPKPQPWLYNAWFQEIYMRTREVNADGYQRSAPIHFAEGLQGKLLIVTGSGETNTHIQIIEGLVDRLIELGKPFDYMVYPNRDHGLREGPGTVVHVRMLILRYLIENLPPGPRS